MQRDPGKRLEERLQELKQLRDEIRLDMHLAGMEAKQRWHELEPTFAHAEQLAGEVSDISREAFEKVVKSFKDFRAEIRRHAQAARRS